MCVKPVRISDSSTAGSMSVPCGQCAACRLNYASMWAARIMHESKFHKKSVFVTLTYRDENLPYKNMEVLYRPIDFGLDGKREMTGFATLVKKDVKDFFKRLRKAVGAKVRYFAAGEYGDRTFRPHYHAVIFGLGKEDAAVIEECWSMGFIQVGDVTQGRCEYIGKYVVKKLNGDKAKVYYERQVIPEFALMSRKPGLGAAFAEKYADEIFNRGGIYVKGKLVKIPRFYESRVFSTEEKKAVLEERKALLAFENHKKVLYSVDSEGYAMHDRRELNEREGRSNVLKGKLCLKNRGN